jgi:hypothetical protein
VPHTSFRPSTGAEKHMKSSLPSGSCDLAAAPPDRRWPIWSARLALYTGLLAVIPLLRSQLSQPEGRETLVMSALAVVLLLTLFLLWAHNAVGRLDWIPRTRIVRRIATFGASCVAVGIFLHGAQADPVRARSKTALLPKALWPLKHGLGRLAIHHEHVGLLPRFSAKLDGASMAPVSIVFLGSGTELLDTFAAAEWNVADRVTVETALRAFARGVMNRPYPCAPVFPVFLDGKLHDVAFQKHEEGDSSRRRHHARWWLTDFVVEGKQVWVATASFDAGVGISRLVPIPIHHIHPDIDAERDYIVDSLIGTCRVELTQEIQVTEPMIGRNAAGDRFFTSGTACVLA